MKIKTTDLIGPTLDWAVAKCEGFSEFQFWHTGAVTSRYENGITVTHNYSVNWDKAGPIIEKYQITVSIRHDGWWRAWLYDINDEPHTYVIGPTPLIAAMRCFVASKLGEEIEVPECLNV